MVSQLISVKDENSPKVLLVPLIALFLDIVPLLVIATRASISSLFLFATLAAPIAGVILGVSSIRKGRGFMRVAGNIIALVAIIIPLACVAAVIVFYVGATTGLIRLM